MHDYAVLRWAIRAEDDRAITIHSSIFLQLQHPHDYTYVLNQEEYRIMPAYDNECRPDSESNRYLRLSAFYDVCLMKINL
nr:MAG TPA: hypothetical protein [Bacteriophage sp.]